MGRNDGHGGYGNTLYELESHLQLLYISLISPYFYIIVFYLFMT